VLVTLTRAEATAKALEVGVPVWITPVANASQVRITTPTPAGADPDLPSRTSDSVPQPSFT
jgi:hypothetical protein